MEIESSFFVRWSSAELISIKVDGKFGAREGQTSRDPNDSDSVHINISFGYIRSHQISSIGTNHTQSI